MAESCLPPIPSPILGPLAQHRLPACRGAAVLYSHRAAGEHPLGLDWETWVLPKCPSCLAGQCWCAPHPQCPLLCNMENSTFLTQLPHPTSCFWPR